MHRTATRATGTQFAQNSVRGGGGGNWKIGLVRGIEGYRQRKGWGRRRRGFFKPYLLVGHLLGGGGGAGIGANNEGFKFSVKLGFSSNENWPR